MSSMSEFISETIRPDVGSADADAMARGMAGLPAGFTWRSRHYRILEVLSEWKRSEHCHHRRNGERYYRKHYYRVQVDTGETMTLYVVRHTKPGENPGNRWRLYAIDHMVEGASTMSNHP
ncbi:MAG: DUF6504 family protein [Phycisphaerae bacterium]